MTDEIKIWAVDSSSNAVEPIQPTDWKETEGSLEDVLVNNPDMLMPGLTLVGRQTPTESGYLDLLGVDADGRLVVFELKRGKLTRDAVAQAIDYCSYLESLSETELATFIEDHSGKHGIDKIGDFSSWYDERQGGKELAALKPTQIGLVGLGVDERAQRMVGYLAESGVDIALLTFHGYQCGDKTLLARQVEQAEAGDIGPKPRRQRDEERRRRHGELAQELGIANLWKGAVKALSIASDGSATKLGITFYLPKITMPDNVIVYGSHSVVIDETHRKIRVTFYPASVHLCRDEFEKEKEAIPFQFEKPPNAPTTSEVSEQWYCLLDEKSWEAHKGSIIALATKVHDTWQEKRRDAST